MVEGKNGPSGFKVVDRRGFSADGTRREDVRDEVPKPAAPPAAPSTSPRPAETEDLFDLAPPGFDTLVSYLSTTAMFQMGLLAGPSGERIPADMVNARRTIDLLEVLQQKTEGNLTPDEAQLLEDVLYELRLSFVEVEKRQAQERK
jgi:hypothetical protein